MKNLKKVLSTALALGLIASVSSLPQASAETNNTSGVVTVTDSAVTKNIAWSDYTANGYALTYGEKTATIPNFYGRGIEVVQGALPIAALTGEGIRGIKNSFEGSGTSGAKSYLDQIPIVTNGKTEAVVDAGSNKLLGKTLNEMYGADETASYLHIGGFSYNKGSSNYKFKGVLTGTSDWGSNDYSPIVAVDTYSEGGTEYNPIYMSGSVSALNNIVKGTVTPAKGRSGNTSDNKPVIYYATLSSSSYSGGSVQTLNILGFQCFIGKSSTGTPVLKLVSVKNGTEGSNNRTNPEKPYTVTDESGNNLYTINATGNINRLCNATTKYATTVIVTDKDPVVSYSGKLTKDEVLTKFKADNSISNVDNFVDYKIYYKNEKVGNVYTYNPYAELTVKFTTDENIDAKLTYTVALKDVANITGNENNGNLDAAKKSNIVLKPFLGLGAYQNIWGGAVYNGSVRSVLFSDVTVGYEPVGDCINGGATLAANAESADEQNIKYSFKIADKGADKFYQYGIKQLYTDFTQSMYDSSSSTVNAATPITEKREIIGYGAALVKGNTATPEKIKSYVQKYGTNSVFGYALSGQEDEVKKLFKSGVNTMESLDKLGSEFSITITSSATDKHIGTKTNMLPFIAYKVTDKDGNASYKLSWAGNNSHFEKNGERSDEIIEAGMARKSVFGLMKSIINNNVNYQTDEQLTALINKANAGGQTSYTLEQLKGYLSSDTTEARTAIRNIFFYGVQQ